MARKFATRSQMHGPKRDSLWIPGLVATTTVAGNTAILNASLNAAALALRPFTIVRTRGLLYHHSDQVSANEAYQAAYGMAVVSEQAAAIGVTAIPTPITDQGSDFWFLYELLFGRFNFITGTGTNSPSGVQVPIDSKAMRKVDISENIVTVVETAGGNGMTLVDSFRMLVKLH